MIRDRSSFVYNSRFRPKHTVYPVMVPSERPCKTRKHHQQKEQGRINSPGNMKVVPEPAPSRPDTHRQSHFKPFQVARQPYRDAGNQYYREDEADDTHDEPSVIPIGTPKGQRTMEFPAPFEKGAWANPFPVHYPCRIGVDEYRPLSFPGERPDIGAARISEYLHTGNAGRIRQLSVHPRHEFGHWQRLLGRAWTKIGPPVCEKGYLPFKDQYRTCQANNSYEKPHRYG